MSAAKKPGRKRRKPKPNARKRSVAWLRSKLVLTALAFLLGMVTCSVTTPDPEPQDLICFIEPDWHNGMPYLLCDGLDGAAFEVIVPEQV